MERIITIILVLFFIFFLLVSCSSQNNQKNTQADNQVVNQNNAPALVEETTPSTEEVVSEEVTQEVSPPPVRRRGKTIRQHYYDGNYRYIISQTFTRNQLSDLYYKAFAYYGLARGTKNNPSLKRRYIAESKKLLKRVGIYASNRELKARAILWYGLLRNVFPSKKLTNYEKISPFAYIKTRLQDTKSYDDALFYAGLVYEKVGYYKSAKINYFLLDQIADNNFVYHYARRKVYPAKTISSYYLRNIEKKLADLRRQKRQQATEKVRPTASPQKNQETANEVTRPTDDALSSSGSRENQEVLSEAETLNGINDFAGDDPLSSLENQEVFYEEEPDPALLEGDPTIKANSDTTPSEESIYYSESNDSQDPVELGEELDVSLDGFLKNLSQKKEKNNQEVFILDDN